ncbi:MAG: isoprenylcysteine carboxylmethyltransferase family protein [Draconibacterium sp.]
MSQFFTSPSGLDARGVGPRIILRTSPFLLAATITEVWFVSSAELSILNYPAFKTAGWLWLAIGIVFFVSSIVQFSRNFPKGKLLTTGMFACSRNPIYSCWILFILPSLWLVFNNWLFLLSAIVMCVATIILVKEEEVELLKHFGKQYAEYRTRVGCIIRFFRKTTYEA